MRTLKSAGVLLLALAVPCGICQAGNPAPNEIILAGENFAGFVERHPDMYHFRLGLDAHRSGKPERALKQFRAAARHADKLSQALIAEMLWNGSGVPQDRAQAYAWMDLAAERGTTRFLALREQYWAAMNEDERARALAQGEDMYAQYGDAAARPRLEAILRREKKRVGGSRTGFAGNITIYAGIPGSTPVLQMPGQETDQPAASMPATHFYAPVYWEPELYWSWREQVWERSFPEKMATVGPLEQVRNEGTTKPEAKESGD